MNKAIECVCSIVGEGDPLFLIHGIGASSAAWHKAIPILAKRFQVITYDLRGHGASPLPQNRFCLDDLIHDLEHLRRRCGIEQAHFAGHSLGGMIAPAYALKYPKRVLSLGLFSTAAFRTKEDHKKVLGIIQAMREKGVAQVLETLTKRWFTDRFISRNPEIVQSRLQQVLDTDEETFLNVFQIYADTEMAPWLHRVQAPCLVLTGEHDGGCSPCLNRQIADALPKSELLILPGYKHSLLLEAGGLVAEHLVKFIGSLERAPRK